MGRSVRKPPQFRRQVSITPMPGTFPNVLRLLEAHHAHIIERGRGGRIVATNITGVTIADARRLHARIERV
jgi:CTP-dependent riboflavin kinase